MSSNADKMTVVTVVIAVGVLIVHVAYILPQNKTTLHDDEIVFQFFTTTEVICTQFVITQYIVTSLSVSTCTENIVFVTVTVSND